MEQDTRPKLSVEDIHARMGLAVTAEGKAKARQRRRSAERARDAEGRAAFLAGLRSRPA
ncbi:hypothetical protein BJY16_005979 [Actinoplanes octamycinicus]|uniref:Uncharacterized protein n=1 Tax=Actinoplanes octamycinicus TaxID=135948 RepID=A0A7W7H1Y8_9ACTN|nr:hypothetical protein [Actinoplanes octamycinicus]MBB4742520.1 hypothetical protein [Actinoplanes octamycinicus]GIE60858.1 hypothetical protein Aoc01nite_62600 [Actinoplanes octamycinicus]